MNKWLRLSASVGLLLVFLFSLNAQGRQGHNGMQLEVLQNNRDGLTIRLIFDDPQFKRLKTEAGEFVRLYSEGLHYDGETGGPELPAYFSLLEIPAASKAEAAYTVLQKETIDFDGVSGGLPLYPHQPPACKNADSSNPFIYKPGLYKTHTRQEPERLKVDDIGMMRNYHLGNLEFSPFRIDEVNGDLLFFKEVEIRISFIDEGSDGVSENKGLNSSFFNLPHHLILGGGLPESIMDTTADGPLSYVIVSDPMFEDSLQQFIEWKRKKGFRVIEAYTNDPQVGNTTTSIRNYLLNLYQSASSENPAPTYLLLVGDVGQIPAFSGTTGTHVSDLKYAEYTGDNLPELYYGRFSATSVSELMPQIHKTLEYEKFLMNDPSFLDEVVMIAGYDSYYSSTYANGQINYGTSYYFNSSNGITSHTHLYPASGSADALIRSQVSAGVAYANYTAHGGTGGWVDPSFNNTHVASLTNNGKYPLMVGNACLTNSFQINACFGETLLRAENKGAIGYIGASNNTYWDEDFYWGVGTGSISANPTYAGSGSGMYDRLWHIHGEPYTDWFVTQGQMIHSGNLAVEASSSSLKKYYWEVYHLMGDPSLMIYLGQPTVLSVNKPSFIFPMATSVQVQTEPYAYVALSRNAVLHGAALADSSGLANIIINPFLVPGSADIVVTKQNRQPFIDSIPVILPLGAYPFLDDVFITDNAGNANAQADYAERVHLSLCIRNAGSATADTITAVFHCNDPLISLVDTMSMALSVPASVTDTLLEAFCIDVSSSCVDQSLVSYTIELRFENDTLFFNESLLLNAPKLSIPALSFDEITGNGNGLPEAGESVMLNITVENDGHAGLNNVSLSLQSASPYVIPHDTTAHSTTLPSMSDSLYDLPVSISSACPQGHLLSLLLSLEADDGISYTDTIWFTAGYPPVAVIDLDPNTTSAASVQQAIEHNGLATDYHTSVPADLSMYEAVFVCLGVYSYNHILTVSEGLILETYLNAGGNVYMEGGDTWAYDAATPVHPYFKINGLADGNPDLQVIQGNSSGFTNGMSFNYIGENNWMDHLAPIGTAFTLFSNVSPAYDVTIAYDGGSYKTIGSSFEFSGLVNSASPNTRNELMHEFLNFFGLNGDSLSPDFIMDNSFLCIDSLLSITDQSSGGPISWFWTFEGGTPSWSEQQNPQPYYTHAGNYDIELSVSNGFFVETLHLNDAVTVLDNIQIIDQPQDTSAKTGSIVSFHSEASGFNGLQWEMSQDNGQSWSVLQDDSVFSGTNTETLQLIIPNANFTDADFRCRYYGYCSNEELTNPASLNIDLTGVVGYTYYLNADSTHIPGVVVNTQGQGTKTASSDSLGWYEISLQDTGNYTMEAQSNAAWGGVNATDALLMLRQSVGLIYLNGITAKAADVDGTGYVNATDALVASQRFVGAVSSFQSGDWLSQTSQFYYDGVNPVTKDIGLLCVGDVDHSYAIGTKSVAQIEYEAVELNYEADLIRLPIGIESPLPVAALSLILELPSHLLIENIESPDGNGLLVYHRDGGLMKISWASLQPFEAISKSDPFFWLTVRLVTKGNFDRINLVSALASDLQGGTIDKFSLILPDIRFHDDFNVGDPYPNPAYKQVTWPIQLETDASVQISIYDISGRLLDVITREISATEERIILPLSYTSGTYFVHFIANLNERKYIDYQKIMIVR